MRRSCAFHRERSSHRGIHRFKHLRRLWLYGVNQDFLEEVVQIPSIQSLYVKGLTATDLGHLSQLPRLRRVIFTQGTKIPNLEWVANLTHLGIVVPSRFQAGISSRPTRLACQAVGSRH